MTLQQLEYVIALDTYRHYVTAAEHSFVSQPNLTMQIQKLEDEIGLKIFDRGKKPIQPTETGKEIVRRAKEILREVGNLKEFVNAEKESLEGEYHVGIIPTLAPYLLPYFLPEFVKNNPKIHFKIQELQTDQIIDQLKNGSLDIGILVTPLEDHAIREIPLFREPFLLYLPKDHPLKDEEVIEADNLDSREILVLDDGHCMREQALMICKNRNNKSRIGFDYQSGSIEGIKQLVRRGVGYTLIPQLSLDPVQDSENIRRFSAPEPVREVSIVVHNSFIKEAIVSRLVETIIESLPDSCRKLNLNQKVVRWR